MSEKRGISEIHRWKGECQVLAKDLVSTGHCW